MAHKYDRSLLRKLAAAAEADERSVSKVIDGLPVRGAVQHRIRAALTSAGIPYAVNDHSKGEGQP